MVSRRSSITARLSKLDKKIDALTSETGSKPILIDFDTALEMLDLAYENLVFEDEADDDRKAHMAALRHLSEYFLNKAAQGKVWLLAARDRNVKRYRESGRLSDAPDTKQQANAAKDGIPLLILMRQNGAQVDGWRDLPFGGL
jgi:hypothetical protein